VSKHISNDFINAKTIFLNNLFTSFVVVGLPGNAETQLSRIPLPYASLSSVIIFTKTSCWTLCLLNPVQTFMTNCTKIGFNIIILPPTLTHELSGIILQYRRKLGARGGAVRRGTALQARRSRVLFPMVSLALGLTQPLKEMSTRNIFWGVKAAGA
jgi:hypothetical protein